MLVNDLEEFKTERGQNRQARTPSISSIVVYVKHQSILQLKEISVADGTTN